MDFEENILPFLKEHAIALGLGVAGLIFLGYGLISLSFPQSNSNASQFQPSQEASSPVKSTISPVIKQIIVDVEGAVLKPGVYKLPTDSRVQDALIAAGGLAESADRKRVAQTLNLASSLTDGGKIYIPAVGEQMTTSGGTSDTSSGTTTAGGSNMVNINQASESELDALPGVGPVTAQKIIDNRPYQSVQELLDKKVVGASEFGKIKDMVSVY
ncbi:MAG TPA: ComEA family DNA-binding protein [Candidatus Acidoferrales bacterium]|nr:ComEA family DNA-binding protein [Candidatus Acidoferrales bacterium]